MIKAAFYISIASLLFLVACQKKSEVGIQAAYTGSPMVNFNNYLDDNGNFGYHKVDLQIKDSFVNANIEIKLTNTTGTAPNDISIYLMKVDALVSDYNTKNGTTLEPVSNASAIIDFDFSKPVILKKGSRSVTIPLRVNTARLDLSKMNAIGIAILRVEGAGLNAGPESKLVVEIGAINKYDGHYRVTGSMVDAANSALTGYQPYECDLETVSADGVVLNPTQGTFAYAYSYPILNGTASSAYGSFTPVFYFNTTTDKVVAVRNYYGQPAPANGRSGELNPAGTNQFSANRTLTVSYWMNQPSVIAGHRSTMVETFTYLGPR